MVYTAEMSGKNYYVAKTFEVKDSLFSISSNNTTVTENADGSIAMNIAAGDSVTLNKLISWKDVSANGKTLFEAYFDVEGYDYSKSEMTVTIINANNSNEWISFRTYFYAGYQITCAISTSATTKEKSWWMDRRINRNDCQYYTNIYDGFIYNEYATSNQNWDLQEFGLSEDFTAGVVTISSTTGMNFRFTNLAKEF